ncbi:hypothetical protein SLE2022_287160 [Rubroshorea leprosula]
MLRAQLEVLFSLMVLAFSFFPDACMARVKYKPCPPFSSFGNLSITYPVRLNSDPIECGEPGYELICDNNRTTLVTKEGKFFVENITNSSVRLVDASLQRDICSIACSSLLLEGACWKMPRSNYLVYILNCNIQMNSSLYVDASACINRSFSPYNYFFVFNELAQVSDFNESCTIEAQFLIFFL